MIIIGERINTSRKPIRQAVEKRDADFIKAEARTQAEAGATHIDVNAGACLDGTSMDDLTDSFHLSPLSLPGLGAMLGSRIEPCCEGRGVLPAGFSVHTLCPSTTRRRLVSGTVLWGEDTRRDREW